MSQLRLILSVSCLYLKRIWKRLEEERIKLSPQMEEEKCFYFD
jgi:hypothetical protein